MTYDWKSDQTSVYGPKKNPAAGRICGQIAKTEKNNLLNAILSLNQRAASQGLRFDDQETSLIVSVLTSSMGPGDKKKVETLRLLSKKLAGRR